MPVHTCHSCNKVIIATEEDDFDLPISCQSMRGQLLQLQAVREGLSPEYCAPSCSEYAQSTHPPVAPPVAATVADAPPPIVDRGVAGHAAWSAPESVHDHSEFRITRVQINSSYARKLTWAEVVSEFPNVVPFFVADGCMSVQWVTVDGAQRIERIS